MKLFIAFFGLFFMVADYTASGQATAHESTPAVIFYETFDWEDSLAPRGWSQPDYVFMEDYLDNGLLWHWWPNDSLISIQTAEPPFQSTTREDGHLCLFGAFYNDYQEYINNNSIHSTIVFTGIDCSEYEGVVLQFETNFRNRGINSTQAGGWQCLVEVSSDYGFHWAEWDASFDVWGGGRPNNIAPGESTLYRTNITGVAAGQSDVWVRITYYNYMGWYFWIIDDLKLIEAPPYDLYLEKVDLEWDDKLDGTTEPISYSIPQFMLGKGHAFTNFKSVVFNMGANQATNLELEVTINHNDEVVYQGSKILPSLWQGFRDSLILEDKYEPKEQGLYTIHYKWTDENEEFYPDDNEKTFSVYVSDSIYNRAEDEPGFEWIKGSGQTRMDDWGFHANVDHFMGSVFPIYADCEIDGLSAYIMGGLADGLIDFEYTLWKADYFRITGEFWIPVYLTKTERLVLDSSMFNTWVYMPFEKDGETELMEEGSVVWAGITYSNYHPEEADRRDKNISIGASSLNTYIGWYVREATAITGAPHPLHGIRFSEVRNYNLMIRLHLHGTGGSWSQDFPFSGFELFQNYPNPFSQQTRVNYTLNHAAYVKLRVTDFLGRQVLTQEIGSQPPGNHMIMISADGLSPGIYYYTLIAGDMSETRKMILVE